MGYEFQSGMGNGSIRRKGWHFQGMGDRTRESRITRENADDGKTLTRRFNLKYLIIIQMGLKQICISFYLGFVC